MTTPEVNTVPHVRRQTNTPRNRFAWVRRLMQGQNRGTSSTTPSSIPQPNKNRSRPRTSHSESNTSRVRVPRNRQHTADVLASPVAQPPAPVPPQRPPLQPEEEDEEDFAETNADEGDLTLRFQENDIIHHISNEPLQQDYYSMSDQNTNFSEDNVSTIPLKSIMSFQSTTKDPSILSANDLHNDQASSLNAAASTAQTSLAPSLPGSMNYAHGNHQYHQHQHHHNHHPQHHQQAQPIILSNTPSQATSSPNTPTSTSSTTTPTSTPTPTPTSTPNPLQQEHPHHHQHQHQHNHQNQHHQGVTIILAGERDNESVVTLASSSRRMRRRSIDTNCSTAGIPPASIMERVHINPTTGASSSITYATSIKTSKTDGNRTSSHMSKYEYDDDNNDENNHGEAEAEEDDDEEEEEEDNRHEASEAGSYANNHENHHARTRSFKSYTS
ncbi:uncharacterized protein LODBEIA_P19490 [Lodderomyces beijingensis]|uniref:Uncharacterized protein n=1 Tax=Lodderomyces beijingensis TaxID=1775926 RepID=A0ABP0ZN67_9ASCO